MTNSRDLLAIRKHVIVAFSLTVVGAAVGEWLKAMLFPERQDIVSHLITMAIAAIAGTIGARWVLRRQAELHERVTAETTARARLEELQTQLIERTVELED